MVEGGIADNVSVKPKAHRGQNIIEYLPYLLTIVGLCVLFVAINNKSKSKSPTEEGASQQSSLQRPHQERVNRYMKEAYNRKRLESLKTTNELSRDASNIVPSETVKPFDSREAYSGADLESANDDGSANAFAQPLSPEEQIQLQLKLKQEEEFRTRAEQEQFIKEFIENARKSGIEIKVDQNLRVRSVRKITPQY